MRSIKNWFVIEHAHPHIYSGVVVWLLSHGWLILGWTILSAPAPPTHPFLPLSLILSTPLSHFVCLNNSAQIQASLESHVSTSPHWLVLQHIIIIIRICCKRLGTLCPLKHKWCFTCGLMCLWHYHCESFSILSIQIKPVNLSLSYTFHTSLKEVQLTVMLCCKISLSINWYSHVILYIEKKMLH